jgi:non-ribosomal peptide synthetase component F
MQPQHGETIRVTPRRSVSGGVDFDVLVSIVERAEGPRIQMEYNTLLFKPERIRGLIASFTRLLGEGLLDPSKPLSQLAVEVDTATSAPATVTVGTMPTLTAAVSPLEVLSLVDRVRAQAEHSPDDLVIAEAARSLTWQQLEEQSSAVAAELARQGAAAGHTIAVCLTPQSESAIALLAAMKTGAAVLPLPPHASPAQVSDLLSRLPDTLLLAPAGFSGTVSFEDFSTLGPAPDFPVQPSGLFLLLKEATTAACATISAAALLRSAMSG